jgi:hypothetical protein
MTGIASTVACHAALRRLVVRPHTSRILVTLKVPTGRSLSVLYCYPVGSEEWPVDPEVVERVAVRSCVRRGAAIDLVLDRARENRSQIVFTKARGRDAVFWQTARVRKQARPKVTTPAARACGVAALPVVVDSGERYAYKFPRQQVVLVRRRLPCGDYGVEVAGSLNAAVERKSLADLVGSLLNSRLKYQLTELAGLAHAAVGVCQLLIRHSPSRCPPHARESTVWRCDGCQENVSRSGWPWLVSWADNQVTSGASHGNPHDRSDRRLVIESPQVFRHGGADRDGGGQRGSSK